MGSVSHAHPATLPCPILTYLLTYLLTYFLHKLSTLATTVRASRALCVRSASAGAAGRSLVMTFLLWQERCRTSRARSLAPFALDLSCTCWYGGILICTVSRERKRLSQLLRAPATGAGGRAEEEVARAAATGALARLAAVDGAARRSFVGLGTHVGNEGRGQAAFGGCGEQDRRESGSRNILKRQVEIPCALGSAGRHALHDVTRHAGHKARARIGRAGFSGAGDLGIVAGAAARGGDLAELGNRARARIEWGR